MFALVLLRRAAVSCVYVCSWFGSPCGVSRNLAVNDEHQLSCAFIKRFRLNSIIVFGFLIHS